ncbi:class I SAM-dependent methyltransferase [Myxosarcina sp. GI1]|uniref:class I SAM-dependent methyltransferase n=1 Tax=Myxosarcina sp. GI1 TaxID=1541065 RepID=UPI00056C26DA|nr:class I SAM-dependent methyltransferase [Myxosarcina sp. GI1]
MTYSSKTTSFNKNLAIANVEAQNTSIARFEANRQLVQFFNSIQIRLAEIYIKGMEIPDGLLKSIFDTAISTIYRNFSFLLISYQWVLTESKIIAEDSEKLMKLQYNLPEKLFCLMLGEDNLLYPKYTMALWETGAKNLREAQLDMLEDVVSKANIQDGDSVLDIGCGWGSAANYILQKFPNAKVTGLNLSREQCQYIRSRMQDSSSYLNSERFKLIEGDFNEVNLDNKFDRIISLGVFEHIGNLTKSFEKISSFLQPNGLVFMHIISTKLPHNIFNPFIEKYIFPRARVWHYDMIPSCDRHLKTVERWFLNGSNYSKTLQAWLNNFDRSQNFVKDLDYGMSYARFRRLWRLYLMCCIAHFDGCQGEVLGNGQYLMVST